MDSILQCCTSKPKILTSAVCDFRSNWSVKSAENQRELLNCKKSQQI